MKRREFIRTIGTGALALPMPGTLLAAEEPAPPTESLPIPSGPSSPFDVGGRAQLFIDRLAVLDADRVSFTLHPAEKYPHNPLLIADRPWEGWRLEMFGNVLYDDEERLFKMWYLGADDPAWFPNSMTLYATSHDGIKWDKPLDGTLPCPKSGRKTNAVARCQLASVMKDLHDPDPERRYKMICWIEHEASYQTMISPDGLHWTQLSGKPICPGRDVITGYYDEQRHVYVAFAKIMTDWRGYNRRVFYLTTSTDFKHWTAPQMVLAPDWRDDAGSLARIEEARPLLDVPDDPHLIRTELYGIGVYPHESCVLTFPWVFTINNRARYDSRNQEGPFELQLAVSRDLTQWERPFRTPCLSRGKSGEWDSGLFTTPSRALRVGDEIWLYYTGSNYTHGTPCLYRADGTGRGTKYTASIGLAKWKLDRFVSVDGPAEGGSLTTVPIIFSGERLEINASVRPGGSVKVEVQDAAGRAIEGFGPSDVFAGDDIRHTVTWHEDPAVSKVAGKPIRLKFHLKNGELYSYAFRGKS
ncbi:MAG: hypothetical protein P4N24_03590 [Acidobacteriota bacterium]|nr:hypothetical protein [Acidobacteriota bacterium]